MTVVYIDRVFVLNALVDYLLLLTTASMAGVPLRRLRFMLLSLLGGVYAVSTFPVPELARPVVRVVFGATIGMLAFCRERRPWRITALFFLVSGALAGLMLALGLAVGSPTGIMQRIYYADMSWGVLSGSSALFYGLLHLLFRQGARYGGGDTVDITISIKGRHCRVRALRDSGNTLRDPVRGQPVLVVETAAITPLLEEKISQILRSNSSVEVKMAQISEKCLDFTLLSYQCIGEHTGLLLAVRSDYLQIGKHTIPRALVALSDMPIGNGCHALWGGREEAGEANAATDQDMDQSLTAVDRAG
ncbi:MAG: sigma-E processing peptidase SpoIIGA [Oscillospiraceae bacterium]|nr:sigma-E processing peptidase SpoIIGA [Oscillospiraceae bacterium]